MRSLFASLAFVVLGCGGAQSTAPEAQTTTAATAPSATSPAEDAPAEAPSASTPSPKAGGDAGAEGPVAGPKVAPTQIGARHVLVQWMGADRAGPQVLRTREQALAIATDVQRRAKAGEDLGRLAVEYSDEPNAGGRGGSLGRFGHGQMVPAFEAAAFKLEVGEISDVIETPFGFHVIQRTE